MAKSGTTSIFHTLLTHPDIDYKGIKENYSYSHIGCSLEEYASYYKDFNVSLNFCPALWTMEKRQLLELSTLVTHYTIIFKNPYHFITSLYNSLSHVHNLDGFINMLLETNQINYAKILNHWETIGNYKPFKILYFEDLIHDSLFYDSIINFLGISNKQLIPIVSNVTKKKNNMTQFTKKHRHIINNLIEQLEQRVEKNLSHWKQYTN
jgi:hypothetical protein